MEAEHMMYVGKHPNIIQLLGVCSIKGCNTLTVCMSVCMCVEEGGGPESDSHSR